MDYFGDFLDNATVNIFVTTNDGNGGAIAPSTAFEAADLTIYKNGSAVQKATTNGITMTSPFDAIIGLHQITIDTSNDTGDAGFWAAGNDYTIVLNPDETIDGQTVVHVLGQFSIENRFVRGTDSAALATDLATAQTDLDTLTGSDGATLATSQPNYAPNTVVPMTASLSQTEHNATQTLINALNNLSASQVNTEVVDVMRVDTIPDSVAADGSASTIAQALYLILQFLTDKNVTGTTVTVRKPNGSTTLATMTLDDGTSPADITRTT